MGSTWQIRVLGVRGSAPASGGAFRRYGGSTSCIAVDCGGTQVVLDAGSGLAGLEQRGRTDILLSHLHLDHIMGLFPFRPLYASGAEVHLYGAPGTAEALARLMAPPLWPVPLSDCQAKVRIHEAPPGLPFHLAEGGAPGLVLTALEGSHPGGCQYYRLEGGGHRVVYALDCELTEDLLPRLTDFARGADLLVWDAFFAPGTLRPGWGHATWEQGLALGREAGIKTVLMTHYGWDHTDEYLHEQEAAALRTGGACLFAREGMVIEL